MSVLRQALRGAGEGLAALGQTGFQYSLDTARDERLSALREKSAETERGFRSEQSALDRGSAEKIASMRAGASKPPAPKYFDVEDEMGVKIQYKEGPEGLQRLEEGKWVPASAPTPVPEEEADAMASELVNEFTTLFGSDEADLGMPEDRQKDIFKNDIMQGRSISQISADFSASRAKGQPYLGVTQGGGAMGASEAPAVPSSVAEKMAQFVGKAPAVAAQEKPPTGELPPIESLTKTAQESARARETYLAGQSAAASKWGLPANVPGDQLSREIQRVTRQSTQAERALKRNRRPRRTDLEAAVKFSLATDQPERADYFSQILDRYDELYGR